RALPGGHARQRGVPGPGRRGAPHRARDDREAAVRDPLRAREPARLALDSAARPGGAAAARGTRLTRLTRGTELALPCFAMGHASRLTVLGSWMLAAGCAVAPTRIQTSWTDPTYAGGPFGRVAVVALFDTEAESRRFEQLAAEHLQERGVEAVEAQ